MDKSQVNSHAKPLSSGEIIALLLMLALALIIRLYHINHPPFDFATLRQYQSAHIARDYYFNTQENIPEWRREVARINSKRMGLLLEPRIMENLAVIGYRILGGEHLWFPRTLSSLFWITGGIFIFLIARKIGSNGSAMFSTVVYLFLPFSVMASRSFQPDPLMVMLLITSIFMIVQYYEKATISRILLASITSALAILVKPYSLFFIFGAYCMIGIFQRGLRRAFMNIHFVIFSILCIAPTVLYYLYGILNNTGYLNELAQGSFLPHLILKSYFWKGWLVRIGNVTGYFALIFAIVGFFFLNKGVPRALLAGLTLGYFIFGLFFTMHIHTHNYYHLPFIPVVSLSAGPLGAVVTTYLYRRWKIVLLSALLIVVISGMSLNREVFIESNSNNGKFKLIADLAGINKDFKKFIMGNFGRELQIAREIGTIVNHNPNTVLLTPYFGRAIAYEGEFSGLPWPIQSSLRERKERGLKPLDRNELFNVEYLTIRTHGKYIKYRPDFFIITDFKEFDLQDDLKNFLVKNYPIYASTEDYLIFDMRKTKPGE